MHFWKSVFAIVSKVIHQNKYNGEYRWKQRNSKHLKQKIYFILILLLIPLIVWAYPFTYDTCNLGYTHVHHKHNEASYQDAWCSIHGGVTEYENEDKTRVDCLTKTHAVEFEFANKWAESIGEAWH